MRCSRLFVVGMMALGLATQVFAEGNYVYEQAVKIAAKDWIVLRVETERLPGNHISHYIVFVERFGSKRWVSEFRGSSTHLSELVPGDRVKFSIYRAFCGNLVFPSYQGCKPAAEVEKSRAEEYLVLQRVR